MKALFAMDLMGGKCVRLQKGDFSKVTVYSEDPVAKITEMMRSGARDFHVIDLDGARTGKRVHHEIMRKIRSRIEGYMEVGGGIRDVGDITYYNESRMDGIIVGTRALEDPAVQGWKEITEKTAFDLARHYEQFGPAFIVYTDISRDGMLTGPNIDATAALAGVVKTPVVASGGVSGMDDIRALLAVGGLYGAIVGKAIYEGRVDVAEAVRLCRDPESSEK